MKSSRVCWCPGPSGFSRNKYTQPLLCFDCLACEAVTCGAAMSQTTLSALATRMANNVKAFLTTRPEPRWDPTTVTIRGWTSRFRAIWSAQGLGTAYNKLRMENWLRPNGQLIGTDVNGNKCVQNHARAKPGRAATPTDATAQVL